mgnify:CR=1 FL=1
MSVFASTNILVPQVDSMELWAVVACDQFTSQPEYWEKVRENVGENPSTVNIIFPEAELECNREERITQINKTMQEYLNSEVFECFENTVVYIERTLKDSKVRRGVLGLIDLEDYSYLKGADTPIRATEQTVLERIPPRVKIRENAPLELPHIMLLVNDPDKTLVEACGEESKKNSPVYDGDLMMNSGHMMNWQLLPQS